MEKGIIPFLRKNSPKFTGTVSSEFQKDFEALVKSTNYKHPNEERWMIVKGPIMISSKGNAHVMLDDGEYKCTESPEVIMDIFLSFNPKKWKKLLTFEYKNEKGEIFRF
jgi:hypothetical protein